MLGPNCKQCGAKLRNKHPFFCSPACEQALAAAARQGGDGTAPGEAPQSGGDSRIAQHQEGASHAR
jgi:hypothetical protein